MIFQDQIGKAAFSPMRNMKPLNLANHSSESLTTILGEIMSGIDRLDKQTMYLNEKLEAMRATTRAENKLLNATREDVTRVFHQVSRRERTLKVLLWELLTKFTLAYITFFPESL